jgi:hypothetical protein
MKAHATTVTKVVVHISTEELMAFAREAGIHIPQDARVNAYSAADQVHGKDEQG